MRSKFMLAPLMVSLCLWLSACGSSTTSSTGGAPPSASAPHCSTFKKIKIAAHLAISYEAFKRYLYNPWQAGDFKKGSPHRKTRIVKAVVAALVGIHEAKVGVRELEQCGAGSKAASLLSSIEGKLTGMKNGTTDATSDSQVSSAVTGLNSDFQKLKGSAS